MNLGTTSSSLFNNNNKEIVPEWMLNMNTDIKKVNALDLEIKSLPAFKEKQLVSRTSGDGNVRTMVASFNETKFGLDAKISLSKFLSGKHFDCSQKTINDTIVLEANISGVPGNFKFCYDSNNGKLYQQKTFNLELGEAMYEYPFSKAGLDECLMDIKNNKTKAAKIAKNFGKYSIINREEIVRRYNGKLREATDKISELITEGIIIGVGSNSYGSFYDLDQLIPQLEKEKGLEKQSEFEFVNNVEHVEAAPYKDSNVLAIESSKLLSQIFKDHKIINSFRDNNELLVSAKVLTNNGNTITAHFNFEIENEKVSKLKIVEHEAERMSVSQFASYIGQNEFLDEYSNNNKIASRIYSGIVLTEKNIRNILSSVMSSNNINLTINDWVKSGMIAPINSTTYITDNSFENLLRHIKRASLTKKQKEEIKLLADKTLIYRTSRQEVEDTGVREKDEIDLSLKEVEFKIKAELSKHLLNYKLGNLAKNEDKYDFELNFISPNNGVGHSEVFSCNLDNRKVINIHTLIGDSRVNLVNYIESLSTDKTLAKYLVNNKVNNGKIIKLSKSQLRNKLSHICSSEDIDNAFNSWVEQGVVTLISNDTIISKHSLEQLLNLANLVMLSEEEINEIQMAKKFFGDQLTSVETKDTGVREITPFVNDDTMLIACNEFLSKIFNSFEVVEFNIDNEKVNYLIKLFNEDNGLSMVCPICLDLDNNKVISASAAINDNKLSLDKIKVAFNSNSTLSKYLNNKTGSRVNAPMILSISKLEKELGSICRVEEIKGVINGWLKAGKVEKIGENVLASKSTLEQLINDSNVRPLSDEEIKDRMNKSIRNKNLKLSSIETKDSDTRQVSEHWSPERVLLESKNILSKKFKHFSILDANLNDDSYKLKIRALNPNNGVNQIMECDFEIKDSKITKLSNITSEDKISLELNSLLENYKPSNDATLGYSSKTSLRGVLSGIMDRDMVDLAINNLLDNDKMERVSDSYFALKCSMPEIVEHLSKEKMTNISLAKTQLKESARNESFSIEDKRMMNDGSRELLSKEKHLSPAMVNLKNKLTANIKKAYDGKLLTANKFNSLNEELNKAIEEKDLELVSKELRRYLV